MSNQSHQPVQNTLAPSALRQGMLDQMNASQEAIQALSDEELVELTEEDLLQIQGGVEWKKYAQKAGKVVTGVMTQVTNIISPASADGSLGLPPGSSGRI